MLSSDVVAADAHICNRGSVRITFHGDGKYRVRVTPTGKAWKMSLPSKVAGQVPFGVKDVPWGIIGNSLIFNIKDIWK